MRHDDKIAESADLKEAGQDRSESGVTDLVFDFSGIQVPDLGDLSLLLTARMLAEEEERRVWVRALPEATWRLLQALGLAHLFQLFPSGTEFGN